MKCYMIRLLKIESRDEMNRTQVWRWLFFTGGLFIVSIGIAFTIRGEMLGIGPWDVFHFGLRETVGLTIGSWSIITGLVIILLTALYLRRWPKIGTWLNMLFLGLFIDLSLLLIPEIHGAFLSILFFVLGVIIMGIGIAMYISPNVGAGPRDSLMLLLVEKLNWSVNMARTFMEVVVALFGWALGGPVGIGTVIIALGLGTFVQKGLPFYQRLLKQLVRPEDQHLI